MEQVDWLIEDRLGVKVGDITKESADAVVNAANSSLMGGGGVDGAIHGRGGPSILEACKRIREEQYPDGLPAGRAVVTEAGDLPARYVIHTVGPVWRGGSSGEAELLQSAYTQSLERAEELGISTVAFPAISTGVYGYPREQAARVARRAVTSFLEGHEKPETVLLVFFSQRDADAFLQAVGAG